MSESAIHHAEHGAADPMSRRVGVMVAMLGILLAVVTISSHRAHTAAVVRRTEANDEWAYYQAKKIREHTSEVASEVTAAVGTDPARVEAARGRLEAMAGKYKKDAEEIRAKAEDRLHQTEQAEHRALAFDLGEGFIELGLVVTSLYFLGRDRLFPVVGTIAALTGIALGVIGFLGGDAAARLAHFFVD